MHATSDCADASHADSHKGKAKHLHATFACTILLFLLLFVLLLRCLGSFLGSFVTLPALCSYHEAGMTDTKLCRAKLYQTTTCHMHGVLEKGNSDSWATC